MNSQLSRLPGRILTVSVLGLILSACGGGGSGSGGSNQSANEFSTVASARVVPPGNACPTGGIQVDSGIDENGNGLLDSNEIDNSEIICNGENGTNGSNSLISIVDEPVGTNCSFGGSRIDVGTDDNNDNILGSTEIDATTYLCSTASQVPANGFPVTDAWGEVWDGLARPYATYAEAESTCNGIGARLPTATELHRNNLTTGLTTSSISTSTDTAYLWTGIPALPAGSKVTVRLTDGTTINSAGSAQIQYRCVWPDAVPGGFTQDACNGLPGSECWSMAYGENLDSRDRLALDYVGASAECAFNNASIPTISGISNAIHGGAPNGTNNWLWAANAVYWYSSAYGYSIARWSDLSNPRWHYNAGQYGNLSFGTNKMKFRCAGNNSPELLAVPATPACNGDCFVSDAKSSQLIADSLDRVALNHAGAASACRALGGELPNQAEVSELIHAGLPNGSNNWMWVSDPMYWYNGNYGNAVVKWGGTGSTDWYYAASQGTVAPATGAYSYRCVWKPEVNDFPVCAAGESYQRVQNSFQCIASTDGDSAGSAIPTQLVDSWGNAWDLQQRASATLANATTACSDLGGRLPTASEVYAVRAGQTLSPAVGDTSAADLIWTKTADYLADNQVTIRVSDGLTSRLISTGSTPYRCVWPSTKGNILSGRSCYGECFEPDGNLIADAHDRPALPVSAATEECQAADGRLPDFREFQSLVQQGWDNGSDAWLWIDESMYWYNAGYGNAIGRWLGIGTSDWSYTSVPLRGGLSWGISPRSFRCVYSNKAG